MKNFDQFKHDFKQDVLIKVIVALRHDAITQNRASGLAQAILEIFSEENPRAVFTLINKLSETNSDIVDIFIKRATEYDDRKKAEDIPQIQIFFRGGLPPESLAKGGEIN